MIDSVSTVSVPKSDAVPDCGQSTTSFILTSVSSDWIPSDTVEYMLPPTKFRVRDYICSSAWDCTLPTVVCNHYEYTDKNNRLRGGHRVRGANIDAVLFVPVHDHENSTNSRVDLYRYSDHLILREWNKTNIGMVARIAQFDIHARNHLDQQPDTTLWVRLYYHSGRSNEVDLELVAGGVTVCRVVYDTKYRKGMRFVNEYLKRVRYWQHFIWDDTVVLFSHLGFIENDRYPEVFQIKPFYSKKIE